jgi:hypothetical protein
MIAARFSRTILRSLLGGGALCMAFALPSAAQVQTSKTTEHGESTKSVKVERGEVVYVSGNNVIIKGEDGELRHFNNVPDSVTVNVDGRQLNVHQIKAGMKIEKQTITTTTPRVVTTVQTVTGTVWHIQPPNSVILRLEDNTTQQFKIPKGQKFMVEGKETDAFGLKKGMKVNAQKVVEEPETVMTQEVARTGKMPPPPPAPKADVPILVVFVPVAHPPVETASAEEPAPTKLPKTASNLPLIGLLGALLCAISLAAMAIRTTASRLNNLRS